MFIRNGQALGSILYKDAPRAARPTQTAEPKKRGRPKKEPVVPPQATRAELDKIADKRGVDDPESLPNKDAVIDAIKEATDGRDDKDS